MTTNERLERMRAARARKAASMTDGQRAALRAAAKPANRPDCQERLTILRREVPPRYRGLVTELANGSQRAAVTLFCLQCVGYVRQDVATCTSKPCPLWPYRPFQRRADKFDGSGMDQRHEGNPAASDSSSALRNQADVFVV